MIARSMLPYTLLFAFIAFTPQIVSRAQAQYLPIYEAPGYDPSTSSGYIATYAVGVTDGGTAVGQVSKTGGGSFDRTLRWDSSGAFTEMPNLGTETHGRTMNNEGTVWGRATKVSPNDWGTRAVRWNTDGSLTELANLGLTYNGYTEAAVTAINHVGQVAGTATVTSGASGERAVRWDTNGAVTELGTIFPRSGGSASNYGNALNDSGEVVGTAYKFISGLSKGSRAVRWSNSGVPLELGNLGTDASGNTAASAVAINNQGDVIGYARKYVSGVDKGVRAVRWDSNGAVVELGNLGTSSTGVTSSNAMMSESGQVAGWADKYDSGVFKGRRAVKWDSNGSAIELPNLGTDTNGVTSAYTINMNALGNIVGSADRYAFGNSLGTHAVYWKTTGTVVDLNDLIDPASGWTLYEAEAISNTGWITGLGYFDPDGPGPQNAYERLFLLQVPEPGSLLLLMMGGLFVSIRRRGRSGLTTESGSASNRVG